MMMMMMMMIERKKKLKQMRIFGCGLVVGVIRKRQGKEREKQMNKTGKERKILHQNKRERKEECVS